MNHHHAGSLALRHLIYESFLLGLLNILTAPVQIILLLFGEWLGDAACAPPLRVERAVLSRSEQPKAKL